NAAVLVREALRGGHGDEGDDRRRADLRRLRLHEGVPGREADAGREAVPDLRRHVADPAACNRARDFLAEERLGLATPSHRASGLSDRAAMSARPLLVGVASDALCRGIASEPAGAHRGPGLSGRAAMSARPLLVGVASDALCQGIAVPPT